MTRFTIPLFLLSALVGSSSASAGGLLRGKGRRYLEGDLVGTYVMADIQYADGDSGPDTTDNIVLTDGSIHRLINGPPGLSRERKSGEDNIQLPRGVWFEANGDVNLNGKPVELPGRGQGAEAAAFDRAGRSLEEGDAERTPEQERNLAELRRNLLTDGTKTVLIVKVVGADASTTATENRLRDSVLGEDASGNPSGDTVTLKSQYDNCSHGQLQWSGAANRPKTGGSGGTDIVNGAVTVQISNTVAGSDNSAIRNAVTSQLQTNFGVSAGSLADHVMVCVPPGTNGGWIGYAYYNYWLSVYNDNWCTYLSIQMHEIGHNLNLAHSNEAGTYKDQTGMMGYSYGQDNGPMMCFNNAKNWQLGWFAFATEIVEPNASWTGTLKGQIDYVHGVANTDKVIVQINGATEDLYVGFNRDAGYNSGTVEGQNQVTIHKRPNGNGNSASELVAKLSAGSSYMYTTLDGFAVEVNVGTIVTSATPWIANVEIVHGVAGPTPPPTPAPTPPPTPLPTPAPSPPPTQPQPTPLPTTAAPTPLPTPVPTPPPVPTNPPTTAQPTNQPTKLPTNQPTTAQPTPPQFECGSINGVKKSTDCPEAECVFVSDGQNGKCCVGHNEAASCAAA